MLIIGYIAVNKAVFAAFWPQWFCCILLSPRRATPDQTENCHNSCHNNWCMLMWQRSLQCLLIAHGVDLLDLSLTSQLHNKDAALGCGTSQSSWPSNEANWSPRRSRNQAVPGCFRFHGHRWGTPSQHIAFWGTLEHLETLRPWECANKLTGIQSIDHKVKMRCEGDQHVDQSHGVPCSRGQSTSYNILQHSATMGYNGMTIKWQLAQSKMVPKYLKMVQKYPLSLGTMTQGGLRLRHHGAILPDQSAVVRHPALSRRSEAAVQSWKSAWHGTCCVLLVEGKKDNIRHL